MKYEELEVGRYYLATNLSSGIERIFKFSCDNSLYWNTMFNSSGTFCDLKEKHMLGFAGNAQIKLYKEKVEEQRFFRYDELETGKHYVHSYKGGDVKIFKFSGPQSKNDWVSGYKSDCKYKGTGEYSDLQEYMGRDEILVRAANYREEEAAKERLETPKLKYADFKDDEYYVEKMATYNRVFKFKGPYSKYLCGLSGEKHQYSNLLANSRCNPDFRSATEEEIKKYEEAFKFSYSDLEVGKYYADVDSDGALIFLFTDEHSSTYDSKDKSKDEYFDLKESIENCISDNIRPATTEEIAEYNRQYKIVSPDYEALERSLKGYIEKTVAEFWSQPVTSISGSVGAMLSETNSLDIAWYAGCDVVETPKLFKDIPKVTEDATYKCKKYTTSIPVGMEMIFPEPEYDPADVAFKRDNTWNPTGGSSESFLQKIKEFFFG